MLRAALAPVLALALLGTPTASSIAAPAAAARGAAAPAAPAVARAVAPAAPALPMATATAAGTTARSRTASGAGAYTFLHVDAGRPTRWNPCQSVPWTFNPARAPAGGLAAVRSAFAELSRRTGLQFQYQGTTRTAPTAAYLQQSYKQFRPLLVGWSTSSSSDLLQGSGAGTVGMARVLWTGSYDATGANRTQIASGVVVLNAAAKARTSGAGSWYTYSLHELGHAVGLGHVSDRSQLMNPVISGSLATYGRGDSAGLRLVGSGGGCLPSVR